MAKPDRTLMLEILEHAAESYPDPFDLDAFNSERGKAKVASTMAYLEEHGLAKGLARQRLADDTSYAEATITAAGMDYISDDGGLTSELGTVTVRIEAETIRTIIMAHAEKTEGSRHQKNRLRQQLEALPEEGLRHLTKQLIDAGLKATPQTIQWLQTLISTG